MTFPVIPTVAAGRVLTTNQTDTTATRTFPSLSSLTKNSGDLLIAIIVAYQSSTTNAQFSAWGGGFTEFHDSGTSTTLAIGAAYKWSDGTETGTFTVTQAATITGHASMILLSIPQVHATTAPEAGSRADGTAAAADPAAFNPAGWGTEDTLWISVVGSGMTSATGSWTACGSTAPTNYSNWVDTNKTDNSTVGECEAAVSFRQLNAASEDVGTASGVDTSNARNSALVIAIRPGPMLVNVGLNTETDTSLGHEGWLGFNDQAFPITAQLTGGYNVNVGLVTETDYAQALGKVVHLVTETSTAQTQGTTQKSTAVGLLTETDESLAVTAFVVHKRDLALLSETDTAQTQGTPVKSLAVGLVTTTDIAQIITVSQGNPNIPVDVLLVTETDTAQTITPTITQRYGYPGLVTTTDTAQTQGTTQKSVAVGLLTETDTAQTLSAVRYYPVGLTTEPNSASQLAASRNYPVGLVTETDEAFALTISIYKITNHALPIAVDFGISQDVLLVTETDTAQAFTLTHTYVRDVGLVSTTDTAQAGTSSKALAVGLTTETDSVTPVTTAAKFIAVGLVTDTGTAQAVTPLRSATIGLASEADETFAVGQVMYVDAGLVTETDAALSATATITQRYVTVAQVLTTDTAQTQATTNKAVTLGLLTETDTAQVVTPQLSGNYVGLATETDTAQAIALVSTIRRDVGLVTASPDELPEMWNNKSRTLGLVSETDTTQVVGSRKTITLGLPETTGTSLEVRPTRLVTVAAATEAGTANGIARLHSAVVGVVADVATAQSLTKVRAYALGLTTETDTPGPFGTTVAIDYRNPSGHTRGTATSRARGASATIGAAGTAATTKATSGGTAAGAKTTNTTGAELL